MSGLIETTEEMSRHVVEVLIDKAFPENWTLFSDFFSHCHHCLKYQSKNRKHFDFFFATAMFTDKEREKYSKPLEDCVK